MLIQLSVWSLIQDLLDLNVFQIRIWVFVVGLGRLWKVKFFNRGGSVKDRFVAMEIVEDVCDLRCMDFLLEGELEVIWCKFCKIVSQ